MHRGKGAKCKRNHKVFPLVKTGDILLSLKLMKWITNQLVCDDGGARRAVWPEFPVWGAIKPSQP